MIKKIKSFFSKKEQVKSNSNMDEGWKFFISNGYYQTEDEKEVKLDGFGFGEDHMG